MRYKMLGPLQIDVGDRTIAITAPREQALLAMLLLHANSTVTAEQLIDTVWGAKQPQNARNQLQASVSKLRKRLADAGVGSWLITTEPAGYRAAVDPADLDLTEFRRLVARGRDAATAGRYRQARSAYRAALGLWRGAALTGIASDRVRHAAAVLDEERTQALEECLDAELATGLAGELIADLTGLIHQHRHRERLHGALMLALYRAGRQADALAAFRNARRLVHNELGTEPGEELQRLHQAILGRDPALDLVAVPAAPALTAPRELPGDVAGFTGRLDTLETLDRLLSGGQVGSGPVVISAIAGTAGVGKTALAVHWAHRVADRFPDGQLFVDLRGYDRERLLSPDDALGRLLASLGVASEDVPVELDKRAARYRGEVDGRRMLILLDNAATAAQVHPLLPGSGTCTVVVTSRDALAGLVARDGVHRLDIDLLPLEDAVALLRRLVGPRIDAEPAAAAALADQCARLPLALRVAAELVVSRPAVPLADLVAELRDRQRRLDLLAADDDPHVAVKTVFSWSIRHLPPGVARTFRLLGLHPGPDLDVYAAAALAGTGLDQARQALASLVRAHLVHPTGTGRYGMHDLLRAYAAHLASAAESERERRAALGGLLDYYLATAATAMDSWHPAEAHRRPRTPRPLTPVPELANRDAAGAWLAVERPCLVAMAEQAVGGWPTHTIDLSTILFRFLQITGRHTDALAIHASARDAAEQTGAVAEQAHALRYLGGTLMQLARHGPAADHLRRALAMFEEAGDRIGAATALNNLGVVEERTGRYGQAVEHYRQALAVFRQIGEQSGEANTLTGLGVVEERRGHYGTAAEYYQQALVTFQRLGHESGEAIALNNLGNVEQQLGHLDVAAEHLRRALASFRALGNPQGQAHALASLGHTQILLGQPARATEYLRQSLDLFRGVDDQQGAAWALNGLGKAALATGDHSGALAHHTEALAIAAEADTRDHLAHAHTALGDVYGALGNLSRACTHYQHGHALYTELGMPEAEQVRKELATLACDQLTAG